MSIGYVLCVICNGSCLSSRNSIQIFNSETVTSSEQPLTSVLSNVLNKEITENSLHSKVICKKCFKTVDELDDLEQRCNEIRDELLHSYESSMQKNSDENGDSNFEKREFEKDNTKLTINGNIGIATKVLSFPTSDDDLSEALPLESQPARKTLTSMTDIELELGAIHGEVEKDVQAKEQIEMETELNDEIFQTYDDVEIIDAGAVEHSSDSDYEPPPETNDDLIVRVSAIAEKNISEPVGIVRIKQEPLATSDVEKPNILKRKATSEETKDVHSVKEVKDEFAAPIVSREDNVYTCLVCEGSETVAGEPKGIIAHMKEAHDLRLYICDVCGQEFRKRNLLSAHLDDHVATEEGDFQCEVCNRIFSNLRLFRIHKRMHYPSNKSWQCPNCGKKYSSKNLLDEHINTHTGARPYVCRICGKDYASKYIFKAHEKTHEIRPRPFQCSICQKSFLSQHNLTQHEKTHLGLKEYSCHLCGRQFGSAHNLEVHSIVHTGFKPFTCGFCGKAFARKAEIRDHERTHTGERPYQCEFCGATFSQRSNLQSHKRATHYDDKRHKCEECGKAFKRRRLLDYHLKAVHTGERPFKCNICEATFVYPEHFKKHRRIHTGEKPFLCEVCGKAFNSRDNRNAHRFVHSDKKPYECLVCGAGFMRKPLLYQHMQSQGHLNDTIVVNQPRLTTDDDQLITVNEDGEMELVDPTSVGGEDSKLYIAEHVLDDNAMTDDESEVVEHIIIDGQQISFADNVDENAELGEDYEEIITGDVLAPDDDDAQFIETPEGPMQLVKVRIPDNNGGEQEAWVKIVPE